MSNGNASASGTTGKPAKTKEMFPYGGRGGINPRHANLTPEQRCQAHKKNGDQCKLPPILGARVCRSHGGAARHVKAAAKARLENAADRMARQLLGVAEDPDAPPAVKLAAIKDALDRAGLSAQQALSISVELKPWEQMLTSIHRGPRTIAVADVVDAEVVAEGEGGRCGACGLDFTAWPEPPGGYPDLCRDCRAAPATAAPRPDPDRVTPGRPATRRRPARSPGDAPGASEHGLLTDEEGAARAAEGQPRPRRKRRS